LRVFVEDNGHRRYIAYLRKGDFFGELSALTHASRAASVEAVSECTVLSLHESTFARLFETYPDFRARIEERTGPYNYKRVPRVPLDFAEETLPAGVRRPSVSVDQIDAPAIRARPTQAVPIPPGPFESEDGRFARRGKRIRGFPLVYQIDEM